MMIKQLINNVKKLKKQNNYISSISELQGIRKTVNAFDNSTINIALSDEDFELLQQLKKELGLK